MFRHAAGARLTSKFQTVKQINGQGSRDSLIRWEIFPFPVLEMTTLSRNIFLSTKARCFLHKQTGLTKTLVSTSKQEFEASKSKDNNFNLTN